jgi:dual-action HEIGH metallo-peptidase
MPGPFQESIRDLSQEHQMFVKAAVLAMTCSALTFGCGADQPRDGAEDTKEIVANLGQAGFPASEIMVVDGIVYVGRDAAVSLQASREMLEVDGSTAGKEQYRTTNLVSLSLRTICVNGSKFSGNFSTALDDAIANYNALPLTFDMRRTTGSTTGCDAVITMKISGPTGGSSGFPSGGLPFNTINIGNGMNNFAVNTIAHVITHELGHTVGFRHSDFFNRSISCGTGGNEGDGGVGAILIQGTPSGATVGGSIMNSCFRTVETGEFTNSDVTALNAMY